jgi:hypothetical protein
MNRISIMMIATLILHPWDALAQKAQESSAITIGPWEVEATYKANKFDHCAMSRTVDDVSASFVRTSEGMTLLLDSSNWKLERGKRYPVHIIMGSWSWDSDVAAEANSVSLDVSDKRFNERLRSASLLQVKGAGATIRIPLDKSAAALERLEVCFEKNSRAIETNPFVAPKRRP